MVTPRVLLGAPAPVKLPDEAPIKPLGTIAPPALPPPRKDGWHGLLGGWAPAPTRAASAPVVKRPSAPPVAVASGAPLRNPLLGGWDASAPRTAPVTPPVPAVISSTPGAWSGLLGGWAPVTQREEAPLPLKAIEPPRPAPGPQGGWASLLGGWGPPIKEEPPIVSAPRPCAPRVAVGVPLAHPAKGRG